MLEKKPCTEQGRSVADRLHQAIHLHRESICPLVRTLRPLSQTAPPGHHGRTRDGVLSLPKDRSLPHPPHHKRKWVCLHPASSLQCVVVSLSAGFAERPLYSPASPGRQKKPSDCPPS